MSHRLQKNGNSTPRTPKSPTIEQYLQGEASAWMGAAPSTLLRDHDPELDHPQHHQKQSVLNRVKEKARRWRISLSKKRHADTANATPSWGVSLEEEDYGEADPEYLGAPMYESEMAPEGYKEMARQHPRDNTVIPEKHVLHSSIREQPTNHCQGKEKQNSPSASDPPNNDNKAFTSTTSTVTEKLAPAYKAVSDATVAIASKIPNISTGGGPAQSQSRAQAPSAHESSSATTQHSPKFYDAPVSGSAPAKASEEAGENAGPGKQMWDKGVSVKEYLMQKLKPGDNESALSQVISDAISPKRAPGDAGVIGKVKEAVTSLLRKDDGSSSQKSSSSQNPASSSLHKATEEASHGRALQTN